MKILVDADALPGLIKDILFRAAERIRASLYLIANQKLKVPKSDYLHSIAVENGFNAADDKIVEMTEPGDLVITADIPLAARVFEKEGYVITPRGRTFTQSGIKFALMNRNFMDELRNSGVMTLGPAEFTKKDSHAFANALNRFLNT
jgi:uncharacterized protein YaiI (UPF0178 family)